MLAKQKRIETIDAMRVLAMLAVIQIHTPWYARANVTNLNGATIADQLSRFAVPFFFVTSGYLWAMRCRSTSDYWPLASALSKRVLLIFCFWSIAYFIGPSLWTIRHQGVSSLLSNIVSVVYPFDVTHVATALLQGTKNHLWFLPALAIAALISGALLARGCERTLFGLALVLFVVGLAGSAYTDAPFGFTSHFNFRNGPFFGLIMFVSGYAIYRHGCGLPLLPVGIGLTMGGFALQLVEITWIHREWGTSLLHDYVVGTYFFGVGMSMIALSNTSFLRARALTAIGPLVLGVYASHYFFVDHMRWLDRVVLEPHVREIAYLMIVFFLALATSFMLAQWSRTKQFVT